MKGEQRIGVTVLSSLCVLVLASSVRAGPGSGPFDKDDDKKKAEQEWRDAEGKQGKNGQRPGQGEQGPQGNGQGGALGGDNPLEKILELMRGVEDRLFQSDTGEFTQDEQKQIVDAMKFEDKTSQSLEELIKKIEEEMQKQQQQQSSGGGEQQQQQRQRQQQQNQNETEEQRREREKRMEEERRQEEQRRMEQQQQPQNQQQQNQPQNDRERRAQQDRQEGRPPDDPSRLDPRDRDASGRWGQLPAKLHQDAQNAQNQDPPARWADIIKRFRERMNSSSND